MNGGGQSSGTDPVAGLVDQLTQPVLPSNAHMHTKKSGFKFLTEIQQNVVPSLDDFRAALPAVRKKTHQSCSYHKPREADEGQSDPARTQQVSF